MISLRSRNDRDRGAVSRPIDHAEHHAFETEGKDFLYLVPSGAVFGLSGLSREIFNLLQNGPLAGEELTQRLVRRGYSHREIETDA